MSRFSRVTVVPLYGTIFTSPFSCSRCSTTRTEGAGRAEAGAERVFAQRTAGPEGQIDDLPLEDGVYFRICFILLFHCVFLSDAPSGPCPGDRKAEVHFLSGVGMDEAEPCALERDVSLDAAAVFAVAPERVAAGRELHPYLMGAPGARPAGQQTVAPAPRPAPRTRSGCTCRPRTRNGQ